MKDSKKNLNLSRKNIPGKSTVFLALSGLILLFFDQFLKRYFTSHSYYGQLFSLHFVKNTGISFGMLQGTVLLMIIISFLFIFALWWFREEFRNCRFCLVLLAAGTFGNLIDRIFLGYVIDFFDLGWFPVFNLADAMITLGTAGIIIAFLIDLKKDSAKKKSKSADKNNNKKHNRKHK